MRDIRSWPATPHSATDEGIQVVGADRGTGKLSRRRKQVGITSQDLPVELGQVCGSREQPSHDSRTALVRFAVVPAAIGATLEHEGIESALTFEVELFTRPSRRLHGPSTVHLRAA